MIGIVSVQLESYSLCGIGGRLSGSRAGRSGRLIAGECRWIMIRIERKDNRHTISWAEEFSGSLLFPGLARSQHDSGVMALAPTTLAQPWPIVVAGNVKHVNRLVSGVSFDLGT